MKILIPLFLLAVCSAALAMEINKDQTTSLEGSPWIVTGLAAEEPLADHPVTFEFDGKGGVSGDTSCNSFGGECRIEGDKITITQVRSTRRACDEPVMAQERNFLVLLASVQSWTITPTDELLLSGPEGEIKARRQPRVQQN